MLAPGIALIRQAARGPLSGAARTDPGAVARA